MTDTAISESTRAGESTRTSKATPPQPSHTPWPILIGAVSVAGAMLVVDALLAKDVIQPVHVFVAAVAVCAFLAAATVRFEVFAFAAFALLGVVRMEPAPSDILLSFLLIIALFRKRGSFSDLRAPLLVHLAAIVILATNFTALSSIRDPLAAARYVVITFYLVSFLYFVWLYVDRREALRTAIGGYVAAAVASAAIGLLGLFNVGIPASMVLEGGQRYGSYFRIQGLFNDANVFGPFLVPAVLILLDDLRAPWLTRLPRWLKVASAIILVVAIVLSFSRAALLNLGLALFVYVVGLALAGRTTHSVRMLVAGAVVVAVAVAVVIALPNVFGLDLGMAQAKLFGYHSYDVNRFAAQRYALQTAVTRPFGLGPMQFTSYFPIGTHSLPLRVLAEQGWLGLAAVAVMIGVALISLVGTVRHAVTRVQSSAAVVVLASLAGAVANGFVIDTLHWRHLWLLLGLAMALRVGSSLSNEEAKLAAGGGAREW